ncbi:11895_t:CDS:2 [Dentiscutata erythropus]|uniref:11895_t:CDS:1 n=1 Tax=Dentiscutata erythropus TaxID=1348616 RepID=A0A9N9JFG2_9GLOM|nr:11895_t:CDS:2 [Dentiscutata erythropus]
MPPIPFLDVVFEKNAYNSEKINNEDENQVNNKTDEPVLWAWIEEHTQMCKYSLDVKKCSNPNQTNGYQLPCLSTLGANSSTLQSHPNNNFQRITSKQQRTKIYTPFSNSISIVESNSISWQDQSSMRESEVVAVLI